MDHTRLLILAYVVPHFLFVVARNTQLAGELKKKKSNRRASAYTERRVTWLMNAYRTYPLR